MNIRPNSPLSCLVIRTWLKIPLGIWLIALIVYYIWLILRISQLETQNSAIRSQLITPYSLISYTAQADKICETIHIALVCMGKCPRQIPPMLKSLLHHRQNPLHFHLIVDKTTQPIVDKLFDTWDLPDVKHTSYDSERYLQELKWIPNTHYSGTFGLIKLVVPSILKSSVKRIIMLDSDLTFLCDMAELWGLFQNMSQKQFIGLVENESDWYLKRDSPRWPALGRGYNTGVMLLDLDKLRDTDWTSLWVTAVHDNIIYLKSLTLADQDVFNTIIKNHPHIVYDISCQYNVQMSTQTLAKSCYGHDRNKVKIVHWNSPTKYNVNLQDAEYFRSIHQSYVTLDGNLLKKKLHTCDTKESVNYKMNMSDLCLGFRVVQRIKLRTHLYYLDYVQTTNDNFDITLVVQLSMDRVMFLDRLVKHWEGPISAAIYLLDCDIPQLERFVRDLSDTLGTRKNVGYHLVFRHEAVHYPVNYLRNVALEAAATPYVFLMDIDFVPSDGLYRYLRSAVQLINPAPLKKCLVIPAFETQRYRASPPRDKKSLLARLSSETEKGDVAPFRSREWPKGHRATNYTKWAKATIPYEVEWAADYEPYLVVHRSVPLYDTRFSGFGWNKVSHSVELRALGYTPLVLPEGFIVHTPHAPSTDILSFRANPHYRICLAILKKEFLDDLRNKYNVTFDELKPDSIYVGRGKSMPYDQAVNVYKKGKSIVSVKRGTL